MTVAVHPEVSEEVDLLISIIVSFLDKSFLEHIIGKEGNTLQQSLLEDVPLPSLAFLNLSPFSELGDQRNDLYVLVFSIVGVVLMHECP